MLSPRRPLASLPDPQQLQRQLQLSPLKGLSLRQENTVSTARGGAGRGRRGRPGLRSPRVSPQPPALSGARVLASKTARRIFQEPAERVSGAPGPAGRARPGRQGSGCALSASLAPPPARFPA